MTAKSSIKVAEPTIQKYFDQNHRKVYNTPDLRNVIEVNRKKWRLPKTVSAQKITEQFVKYGIVNSLELTHTKKAAKILFQVKDSQIDPLEMGINIQQGLYYTHYTAMSLHELTNQIPKSYYLNCERSNPTERLKVSQEIIDQNFSHKVRKSSNIYTYLGLQYILQQGVYTNKLGVIYMGTHTPILVTDLERTLIDISVRPGYSGGVMEVLEAFRIAKNTLKTDVFIRYLSELNFSYPYHQAIGFYMSHAEYGDEVINHLKSYGLTKKFYLTHNIKQPQFSEEWNLVYPLGF